MVNTLLSSMHRLPSDTQDTQKKRLELSTLFFNFLFVNLFADPFYFFQKMIMSHGSGGQ